MQIPKKPPQSDLSMLDFLESITAEASQPIEQKTLQEKYNLPNSDRRVAPRFAVHFDVVIYGKNGASMRTQTVNISESGMLMHDPLPPDLDGGAPLEIILVFRSDQQHKFMAFRGNTVSGPNGSSRIAFSAATADSQKNLLASFEGLEPL